MTDLVAPDAQLEKLYTGTTWAEGPVWLPKTRSVRWSDIPNNRIMEYNSVTGETHVHREHVEFTNGRTLDLGGHVIQCSHGLRRVEREIDGTVEVVVDHFGDHRLNSPNDVVVASDGSIWFTDPPYGILPKTIEGHPGELEYGGCWVFRLDPGTSDLTPVITDMVYPNGLAFSPDESILYVADSGPQPGDAPSPIRAYDVVDNSCVNGRIFATVTPGLADGFRVDEQGRIWTSSLNAVQVFSPSGELLHKIDIPEKVANVCFGGEDGHDLYITASSSLYRIRTLTKGAPRPAPRR